MKFLGRVGHLLSNRTVATTGVMALLSTAIVVAAVESDGSTATNVRLDDGSVWVVNHERGLVGRLNIRIDELDFSVVASNDADVLQETVPTAQATAERTVVFSGRDGGVKRLDVPVGQASGDNEIPIVDYRIGGGVGAVLDRASGALWVGSAQQIVAPSYPDEPDAIVALGSWMVVTQAPALSDSEIAVAPRQYGSVIVVDGTGWYEVALGDDLEPIRAESSTATTVPASSVPTSATGSTTTGIDIEPAAPEPIRAPVLNPLNVSVDEIAEVSAVGQRPVVLLTDGTVVLADGTRAKIGGDDIRLQQPGDDAGVVLVASTTGLYEVSADGEVTPLVTADASPAAPVRVGPCVYGAWSGATPRMFRACNGEPGGLAEVTGAKADAQLVWRVNQRNVALNDERSGDVWADHDGTLAFVGNWSDVEPRADDPEDVQQTTGESQVIVDKKCLEGGSAKPRAGDDQVGLRPRQSIIDLLNNDDDDNCEPIAITDVQPDHGAWGQLTIIDNGQHVLFSPTDDLLASAGDAIQSFDFSYTVSDIGGHTDDAEVTVSVKGLDLDNVAPALRPKKSGATREMRAVVEEGRTVTYNVVPDWWDPDGDDLRLVSATPEGDGRVSSTPDGGVRFDASGVTPGVHAVAIVMSDGIESASATLEVTVKPLGSAIPPIAAHDFVTVVKGGTVEVSPLDNDSDPNETELDLRPLWTEQETSAYSTVVRGDTVEITANQAGVFALEYEASDGTDASKAAIRLEIVEPGEVNSAPIAVPDQVKLRADRVVNVDVLSNDVDADGDLLAVTNVAVAKTDPSFGIARATLVDRRMVQLEVVPGPSGEEPTGPFVVTYDVTDAHESEREESASSADDALADSRRSRGAVTVLVQPASEDQAPILLKDSAVVRAGDVVAVPVLRNDIDPDSDPLTLAPITDERAQQYEATGKGVVWAQGREIYFQGREPGSYDVTYTATAAGRSASTTVTFVVRPTPDAQRPNRPPDPDDLVLRAVRNGTVRLNIPTFGVDPDGDSVELLEELGAPSDPANRVELDPDNPGVVLFTAGRRAGATDTFTYTVRDRYGDKGAGTVTVMIVEDGGWEPQAHDDVFRGRPGRVLSIPVVANDTSPQDRRLEIAELPFFDAQGQPASTPRNADAVRLLDQQDLDTVGRIEVTVPDAGTTLVEQYRISDRLSQTKAAIRVTGDPAAPNLPPVAVVDRVKPAEIAGRTDIDVDVLVNDFDPDDADNQPTLSLVANQPATLSGSRLAVTLQERSQTVLYRITDAEGAAAIGVVLVPGIENHPPQLTAEGRDPAARTIDAATGEPMTIRLDVITEDPDGASDIRLTDTEVQLSGVGDIRRLDDGTGFVYTPPAELSETQTVSITFEATDKPDKSKAERQLEDCNCLATLTVGVVVEASSPPYVVAAGAVEVPQLKEPVQYDLAGLTADDQDDELVYQLDSSTFSGLDVEQNGSVLTIVSNRQGADSFDVGRQIRIDYTVKDEVFDPVPNSFVVTIVKTNRGQPAPGQFQTIEAERDAPYRLPNILSTASNPFAADGLPLTLTNWSVTGRASLDCSTAGDCEFLSDTVGNFTVSYTLQDALEQTATGTIAVVVKGKPLEPAPPRWDSVGDELVNLTWTAPDDQGSPIIAYHVTAVETGETKTYTQTGGAFDGLPNAQEYHFIVVAENELGMSPPSAESTAAIPDRVPSLPELLEFPDYQDSQLMLAWSAPSDSGEYSAITAYQVKIGGQTIDVDGGTTSIRVGGSGGLGSDLLNGTDYDFEVRAKNAATTNGGWGEWATSQPTTERPSRQPDAPAAPVAVNAGDGGTPRVTVTWSEPYNGGRDIAEYDVCRVQDGQCQTIAAPTTQATFDQARNQTTTFTVVARNTDKNRSDSDTSPVSASVTTVGTPDAPVISSVTPGDHQLTAIASTPNGSGCSQASNVYSRDSGASWQASPTFTGLTNAQSYTIVAKTVLGAGCYTNSGQPYESAVSNAVAQTPYGTLRAPTMSVSGGATSGSTVTWTWNIYATQNNDTGRPWNASTSGACGSVAASAQAYSNAYTGPTTQTCTVTITSGATVVGSPASASVNVPAPPPPQSVTLARGAFNAAANGSCGVGQCKWVNLTGTGFSGSVIAQCWSTQFGWDVTFSKTAVGGTVTFNAHWMYGNVGEVYCTIGGVASNHINPWKNW